jgi:glutathione S-transferase
MQLFYSATSPYARKVRMVAIETGLNAQITSVAVNVADDNPALFAANPLGKVPALLLDNGEALFDSPVICRYTKPRHKIAFHSPRKRA